MKNLFLLTIFTLIVFSCTSPLENPNGFPIDYDGHRPVYDYRGDSIGIFAVKDNYYHFEIGENKFWTTLIREEIANLENNRLFQIRRNFGKKPYHQTVSLNIYETNGKPILETHLFNPNFKSLAPGISYSLSSNANLLLWGITKENDLFIEHFHILDKNGTEIFAHKKETNQSTYYCPIVSINSGNEFAICYTQKVTDHLNNWILESYTKEGQLKWSKSIIKRFIKDIALSDDGKIALIEKQSLNVEGDPFLFIFDKDGNEFRNEKVSLSGSNVSFRSPNLLRIYRAYFDEYLKYVDLKIE